MIRYSDEELESLLDDTESDIAERKESWKGDAPDTGRQAVCAFANDLPDHRRSGVLFVGAKSDGIPSCLSITDELLRTLSDIRTDGNILPPPSILVDKRTLKGSEIAVVTVQPSDSPPVRYKGRIWIRVGPRRAIAAPQEERILNERRRYRDIPFDVQSLPSSDLSALSRILFEQEYLPNAVAPDVLATNDRSYQEKLSSCRMIASTDDPTPTIMGVLVLGNWNNPDFELPQGKMLPLGYIVQQHSVRLSRPVKAFDKWINRMPTDYHDAVLKDSTTAAKPSQDPACLATLKHYLSLIPMGQEARKPIFHLTPADGAIGSHAQAVQEAYKDFKILAEKLLEKINAVENAPRGP